MRKKVQVKDIIPNKENPRNISKEKYKKLIKSITDFPQMLEKRPLVVDEDMMVLGGNMRLKALQKAGIKEVIVDIAEGWTDEQKKEFIIKDNVGFGDWDFDVLANEWDIDKLNEWGLDFDFKIETEVEEDDYVEPDDIKVDVVLGDIIEIGKHRLICGDSTDSKQVAILMNKKKADMIFTDPPYNANYKSRGKNETLRKGIKNDNMQDNDFDDFINAFISTSLLSVKDTAPMYFCCNWKDSYPRFYFKLLDADINISANIVWNKGSGGMGWQDYRFQYEFIIYCFQKDKGHKWYADRKQTDIWDFNRDNRGAYKHPTQKPVELSSKAIQNSSKKNNIILDLFLGSGSTMMAAHQLDRICYGMELDPKYCQVIIDRMINFDSDITVKINGKKYKSA